MRIVSWSVNRQLSRFDGLRVRMSLQEIHDLFSRDFLIERFFQ